MMMRDGAAPGQSQQTRIAERTNVKAMITASRRSWDSCLVSWWVSDNTADGKKNIATFLKPDCIPLSVSLLLSKQGPAGRRLRSLHTPTHTCTLINTLLSKGWGGPLLHDCSERRHPSRDQRTPVNPLLKILANPLGLLRIASGHCVCHESGIRQWKAVNGAWNTWSTV